MANHQTISGRPSGKDCIPAEIYKAAGPDALGAFHDVLLTVVKKKGSRELQAVSLLSFAGKIFAWVILNRLITVSEQTLPEAQCGFRPDRSTVDMIFAVRQLQEKCIEQNRLDSPWTHPVSSKVGVDDQALPWRHDLPGPLQWQCDVCFRDQQRREAGLRTNPSPLFPLYAVPCYPRSGEGCLPSLSLGRLPFRPASTHSKDEKPANSPPRGSLCQRQRTNGPRRRRPAADSRPLLRGIQALQLDNQSRKDGVAPRRCSTNLHHTTPSHTITINDKPLANVERFKYLGSIISCDGSLDRGIDNRFIKASQALGSLRNWVLNEHNAHLSTKLKVYNAVVLSSLLYSCETLTLYCRHIKKLELFHMRALRSILGIRWQDHITNMKILDQAKSASIEATIIKVQLRWVGHVSRMEECRMPRRLMYG